MIDFFGFIMFVAFGSCCVPQIIRILRTKSALDVSVSTYILTIVGYIAASCYMFLTGFGIWWCLNYFFGLITSSWVLYLCYKHRK